MTLRKFSLAILLILGGLLLLAILSVAGTYLLFNKTNGELNSSGTTRKYLLYEPQSYDPSKPTALIISIHGFAEWPAHQMGISRWNDLADQYGFIVVYPSGTHFPLRWDAYAEEVSSVNTAAEVQFIADLIDKLSDQYNIDSSRIFANGLSNGGGMSVLLSCQLSERIAAIGTVSGAHLLPWEQCVQSRPVPIIALHGTEDPIVPYGGGQVMGSDLHFPSMTSWIMEWVQRNGCDQVPMELPTEGIVSGVQYTGCDRDADVVFYTVDGGGHAWPGGEELPEIMVGHTTQDIDATRVMWEFFNKHPLKN